MHVTSTKLVSFAQQNFHGESKVAFITEYLHNNSAVNLSTSTLVVMSYVSSAASMSASFTLSWSRGMEPCEHE